MKKIFSMVMILSLLVSNINLINANEINSDVKRVVHTINEDVSPGKLLLSSSSNATNIFSNLKDASNYLSSEMVKRNKKIKIGINQEYYDGMYNDLFDLVFEKTDGTSSEGDYLYWHLSSTSAKYFKDVNYVEFEITLNYLSTYEQEVLVDKKVKQVLDELNVYNASEYQKVKAVHDYIAKNINYDNSLTYYSAYDAIIRNNVVCQGYASLTYKMLKELGVNVRVISGYSKNESHGWNIVKIGDKWYNIDNTWDENLTKENNISYKYFLKNNQEFTDHTRDNKFNTAEFNQKYPMANSSFDPELNPNHGTPQNIQSSLVFGVSDIKNHWAEGDIVEFLKRGYIGGYEDNTFRPNGTITKAEFIKIVNLAFNITPQSIPLEGTKPVTSDFIDVPKNSWFYNDVMTAVNFGYIKGEGNFFNPNEELTREDIAVILTTLNSTKDSNLQRIFTYNDWHKISANTRDSVEGAIKNDYIRGYSDNTIKPNRLVTRAEAIVMLNRILNK